MSQPPKVRLALDQNFPVLVLDAARLLPEVEIASLHKIDPRLSDLDDRKLLIALGQLGWHGLITNNYKMLWVPTEIAAVLKTRLAVFAVQGLGGDPLRAISTGAVLLELPDAVKRIIPGKAQIFRVSPRGLRPQGSWLYFQEAAKGRKAEADVLYREVRVTDEELAAPIF